MCRTNREIVRSDYQIVCGLHERIVSPGSGSGKKVIKKIYENEILSWVWAILFYQMILVTTNNFRRLFCWWSITSFDSPNPSLVSFSVIHIKMFNDPKRIIIMKPILRKAKRKVFCRCRIVGINRSVITFIGLRSVTRKDQIMQWRLRGEVLTNTIQNSQVTD